MLRFLLWRLLGLLALIAGLALISWFLDGGPGKALRGSTTADGFQLVVSAVAHTLERAVGVLRMAGAPLGVWPARLVPAVALALAVLILATRLRARRRRRYVRLRVDAYRADRATAEAVISMFDTVQFLDSARGAAGGGDSSDGDDGADPREDRELLGVGAGEGDLAF